MSRYTDSRSALSTAMRLMIDEGDTLLVAAISHPLDLVERKIRPFDAEGATNQIERSLETP